MEKLISIRCEIKLH